MKPRLIDNKPVYKDAIYVKQIALSCLNAPLHFHNDYEMVLILKSCGKRVVGDHIEDFDDGDLVLLGPDLPHVWYNEKEYYAEDSAREVNAIVTYFRPVWLHEEFLNVPATASLKEVMNDLRRGIKVLGASKELITQSIIRLAENEGLKRVILLLQVLDLLADQREYQCLASEGYSHSYNQRDVARIDKVYQYVMANFNSKITLEAVAAIAHMTPSAFCKYFKARTQKTFIDFVNEVRIGFASKLLINSDLSISQVCYDSGFNNLANFNRNFKHYTKKSPREFRVSLAVPL